MVRKRQSDAAKIAAILQKFNIQTDTPIEIPEANYNSNNAVAMFARVPEHFVMGKCMECELDFAHNQPIPAGTRVGYCSDTCRKRAFKKSTGIEWGMIESPREPWDGDPPMIITPDQLKNLEKIAEWFTRNRTTLTIQYPEPEAESESPEDREENPEDYQSPTSLSPGEQYLAEWDAILTFEQENQHQAEVQTSPQYSHVPSMPEQTGAVDDPFDF